MPSPPTVTETQEVVLDQPKQVLDKRRVVTAAGQFVLVILGAIYAQIDLIPRVQSEFLNMLITTVLWVLVVPVLVYYILS